MDIGVQEKRKTLIKNEVKNEVKNMKVNIGLKEQDSKVVAEVLNQLLADEHVFYIKTRNAHWNLQSADFHPQHLFLEEIYTEFATTIDDIAERIRTIGHFAVGTMREFLEITNLKELSGRKENSLGYIEELTKDLETIIRSIRENLQKEEVQNDLATEDFLTALLGEHEKTAWMLRSHLS